MFYQAVMASILLYHSSESWVVPPRVLRELEGFHMEASRCITGMHPQKVKGEWVYPHSADVLAAMYSQLFEYYIQKRRHTVLETIQDGKTLKECRGAKRRRGTPSRLFWCAVRQWRSRRGGSAVERGEETRYLPWWQAWPTVAMEDGRAK